MKKIFSLLTLISFSLNAQSQYFPEGYGDKFEQMLKEGIYCERTSKFSEGNEPIERALKENWTISDFKILKAGEAKEGMLIIRKYNVKPTGDTKNYLGINKYGPYENIAIIKKTNSKEVTDKDILCRMSYNGLLGFDNLSMEKEVVTPFMIKYINKVAHLIYTHKESEKMKNTSCTGISYMDVLREKNKDRRNLRLILPYNGVFTKSAIKKLEKLDKYNINYKVVQFKEFIRTLNHPEPNDCIIHWGTCGQLPVNRSIIEISTGEMILSEMEMNMKNKPYLHSRHEMFKLVKLMFIYQR